MLVALRFVIGAHFFHEGYSKWRDPKPFSGPFFSAAKGPFAKSFHKQVWDKDGLARLDDKETKAIWTQYVENASQALQLNEKKAEAAKSILALQIKEYDLALNTWADDIEAYKYGLERRDNNAATAYREYDSFKKHDARIATELAPKRLSWQSAIDKLWRDLEADINQLADGDGKEQPYVKIGKPGRFEYDSEWSDQVIPYFHMIIGVLLVIGLLTRVSALLAAAFLASVIASQWPFTPGTINTSYQQVEFFAALLLAGIGAGRWAGLDAVLSCCCCCSSSCPSPSSATQPHH